VGFINSGLFKAVYFSVFTAFNLYLIIFLIIPKIKKYDGVFWICLGFSLGALIFASVGIGNEMCLLRMAK